MPGKNERARVGGGGGGGNRNALPVQPSPGFDALGCSKVHVWPESAQIYLGNRPIGADAHALRHIRFACAGAAIEDR